MRWAVPVLLLVACDNRQAIHPPDPTLARMQDQPRIDPYGATPMREPPSGVVAYAEESDEPPKVDHALMDLGRARFETVCATCHGILGDGQSMVGRAMRLRPPPSLHEPRIRSLPRKEKVRIMTDGYGLMPSYAWMLPTRERWAIAAYLDALSLSREVPIAELSDDDRSRLR